MNKPFGPALMSCIKQNDKYKFEGLNHTHNNVQHGHHSEFQSLARDVAIPWHQIYYAIYITEKYGKGNIELLRWFIIHLLYESGSGHLRTDLRNFSNTINTWFLMERDYFPGSDQEFEENNLKINDIKSELIASYKEIIKENGQLFGSPGSNTPFIIFEERQIIYIRKYFKMEKQLLATIDDFSGEAVDNSQFNYVTHIKESVDVLNRSRSFPLSDKVAKTTLKLLNSRLLILSGGPGTGKTTTITAILRILKLLEKKSITGHLNRIRLAAPTGRAANRMIVSIRSEIKDNPLISVDNLLPEKAYTLHKLIGINPVRKDVLYNKERPIPADLIILDEASMVDARMMSLLFDALSPTATLLLVGDKDQLPSVDAGAVFGDLVTGADKPDHILSESVVMLKKSWRSTTEILDVAKEVISGNGDKALELLKSGNGEVRYDQIPEQDKLISQIISKYDIHSFAGSGKRFFSLKEPESIDTKLLEKVFSAYENFAVLIPSRKGNYGVERINNSINQLISGRDQAIYHGQPIMIRTNDYNLSLFNGDRGVFLNFGGDYYAVFKEGHESYRYIPAGKLNSYETAYAQTIHKSQGSEFREIFVLIPEGAERLLTREIVYTGITRAKLKLNLFSSDQIFKDAVSREVVRHSGIREFMRGKNGIQ